MTGRRHDSTYARLVANTAEPDSPTACWHWTGATRRHGGGDRPAMSDRVPGVRSPRKVNPCRTMLEQFGPLPDEHNASHLCNDTWLCVHPDHLIGESLQDNLKRRDGLTLPLPAHVGHADHDPDWRAGVACDPNEVPF